MPKAETYRAISLRVVKALAAERQRCGFSQNRLAEMSGLSLSMVNYVERGMRNPTLDTLLRISIALGINLGVYISEAMNPGPRS